MHSVHRFTDQVHTYFFLVLSKVIDIPKDPIHALARLVDPLMYSVRSRFCNCGSFTKISLARRDSASGNIFRFPP